MRWSPGGRSDNLEDRRGASGGGGFRGGGGGGMKLGLGGTVVLLVLSLIFKRDLLTEFSGGAPGVQTAPASQSAPVTDAGEEKMVDFVSFVLDTAQVTWRTLVPGYTDARLVLFREGVRSACGDASAASGPFYCPGDQRVYVDLSFFDQLDRQFGAPGDFAQAYVLAHEIGHHVQNLTGTEKAMRNAVQRNPAAGNQLSVAMELQADCYAGVWAHSAARSGIIEAGDLDEGLGAAAAVGDDRLQKMSTGRVNPESFTHGSSTDRKAWFRKGFDSGDPRSCDTFGQGR
ncbi:KPN_02809 family neutral zinc metallopeptidase [Gemmatimonas groenlandica]|uniref:Zinc metallopeptidase n=1 Tax=Gemmatimonas groenlandica TaxID=2732249 RepID=A0A6M4IV08_9BACT|nr:neutral zinc metallopeptidase [Gemmatimonas groenlandica]QJR38008.1 zinc metallopeptidase [Gemmatimonas groenlandica]